MKLPSDIALGMQNKLCIFTYSCYCPDALLSGLTNGTDQRAKWQTAIDTMYRFLVCNLIWSPSIQNNENEIPKNEYLKYANLLAKNNPFTPKIEERIPWHYWDLCATELCQKMIENHNIRDIDASKINGSFILELERLFEENSVEWSNDPLVKIEQ
jgi:hypothetical protein